MKGWQIVMDNCTLDKLHGIQLEILDVIVSLCKANGITYYLAGGSVLGAIRHKGIIPWDDDIDVMMYRDDFIKFEEICKNQLPKDYFYQSINTDPHYHHIFSKIRKNNTLFIEKETEATGQHNGIFVDIFPIDSAKNETGIQHFQYLISNKIEKMCKVKDGITKGNYFDRIIICLFDYRKLIRIQNYILTNSNTKSNSNKYYVNFGSQYGIKKQTMLKSVYYPPIEVKFEGRMCCIPNNYDYYLRRLYGDSYMELPPVEKRVTHNPLKIKFD